MSHDITLIAKFKIHEGKLEQMRALYDEAMEMVKQQEPDTTSFTLYVNEQEAVCVSYEIYKTSEAILENFRLSQDRIQRVLETSDVISCDIYGDVSQDVIELLTPYGANFYGYDRGYRRS